MLCRKVYTNHRFSQHIKRTCLCGVGCCVVLLLLSHTIMQTTYEAG